MSQKKELGIKIRTPSYIHVNPSLGQLTVNSMSPVVVMKKIKLRRSDGLNQLDERTALPELDDELGATPTQGGVVADRGRPDELYGVHTMTLDELEHHVQKCLQMSLENKITQKNAFALQLIDCMNILVQKKQDFSTMACTLDAGAKIYSYRVDALYQQVMKLAVEVIHHQKKNGGDAGDKDVEKPLENKLKRDKRAKKNVIASSDTLNRKVKGKDPKDRFIKVEALPGALLSGVRRDPTDLSFSLENDLPFWQNWDDYKPMSAEGEVALPRCTIFRKEANTPHNRPNLLGTARTELATQTIADDIADIAQGSQQLSQQSSYFEVAVDDGCSDNEECNEPAFDQVDVNMESAAGNEISVISTAKQRLAEEAQVNGNICNVPSRFEILKILFNRNSDYHYLDMKNAYYWAGPEFWKRPTVGNRTGKEKKASGRKRKCCKDIIYDVDNVNEKWKTLFRKGQSLARRTVKNWKKRKFTLPVDLQIEHRMFLDLFHISKLYEHDYPQESTEFIDPTSASPGGSGDNTCSSRDISQELTDRSGSQDPLKDASCSNSAHLNSAFYDASLSQPLEAEDPGDLGKVIKVVISASNTPTFDETSMVPAPKRITYEPIKYKTRPIRVNMQHLKETVLGIIVEDMVDSSPNCSQETTRFSRILEKLPGRLERRTAADLSPAMTFLALLTLANENNLHLQNNEDFTDVSVSFENNPPNTETDNPMLQGDC